MPKKSLSDNAYEEILENIVTCKYWPGSALSEDILVKELGISRTPIHNALIRLQQENLVTIHPKRGIRVNDIDPNQIRDIFNIRDVVEPYCIRKYGHLFSKEKLLEYQDVFSQDMTKFDKEYVYHKDVEFHTAIVDLAGNSIISTQYRLLHNLLLRINNVAANKINPRLPGSNQEHTDIIEKLLIDDDDSAAEKMELHLKKARESAYLSIQYLKEEGAVNPGINMMHVKRI